MTLKLRKNWKTLEKTLLFCKKSFEHFCDEPSNQNHLVWAFLSFASLWDSFSAENYAIQRQLKIFIL